MKLLKEALSYKEGVVAICVIVFGLIVCFVGGNFVEKETTSFFVVVLGSFISISGSTEFAKVIRAVRDKMNDE